MSTQNICNICGANYEYRGGRWKCPACGAYKAEELSNEEVTLFYNAAQKLRLCDFDEAEKAYIDIIEKFPKNANGYWGRLLSRYGIKYEEDFDGRKIPTCYAASIESVLSDKDYRKALELADADTKAYFDQQAQYIERVRKEWIERAKKEKPYDIFICYKDSDLANGIDRTQDSIAAQDLYIHLTEQGYRVFFSRESLRDKVGEKYEPYIFNALSTAKVMLVYGTSSEYITSTWLKNEWTRYEKRLQAGEKKPNSLIVACDGFSPAELPKALSSMQCFDATKRSFYTDLDVVLKHTLSREKETKTTTIVKETVVTGANTNIAPLLKRAFLFLEDGDFESANEYSEKILDINPECSDAYIVKLLIDLKLQDVSQIGSYNLPINRNPNYIKALRFANDDMRNTIEGYNQAIVERIEFENSNRLYINACSLMNARNYDEAISTFTRIKGFKDSTDKLQLCKQMKETDRKEAIYREAVLGADSNSANDKAIKKSISAMYSIKGYKDSEEWIIKLEYRLEKWYENKAIAEEKARTKAEHNKKIAIKAAKIGVPSLVAIALVIVLTTTLIIPLIRYNKAEKLFSEGKYNEANLIYSELDGFSNSEKRIATTNAIGQIERKKIALGIKTLLSAGIPVELTYLTDGGSLTQTQTLMTGCTLSTDESIVPTSSNIQSISPENNVFIFNVSSDFSELKIPGRNGYRFVEWILDTYSYDIKIKDAKFCLSLKATWSEKDYVIEYDLAGGTNDKGNPIEYDPEDEAFTLINPMRTGYTFAGWIGTDISEPTIDVTIPKGSYGDREYTATWKANEYTLRYDTNGGNIDSNTQTVKYQSSYSLSIPSRDGYTFKGWFDSNGKEFTEGTWRYTRDIEVVAKWDIITYKISYTLNGGTMSQNIPSTYTVEDTVTIPNATYPDSNYEFVGWTYHDHTTPTVSLTIPKGTFGDIYLTANYEGIPTTITLDSNGGKCETTVIFTKYNSTVTLPSPTKTGYTFKGWFSGDTEYTSGIWNLVSSITLVAKWETVSYGIYYSLGGGTVSGTNPAKYTIEDSFTLINPTKTGYTFLGWTYDGQSVPKKNVTVTGSTGVKSFVAKWEANTYTITFDANGGTGVPQTMIVTYNKSFTLPEPTHSTNSELVFAGWYVGDNLITSGTWELATSITVIADWELKKYDITYNLNGGSNASTNPTTYTIDDTFTLSAPSKEGYTFLGWTYSGQSTPTTNVTITNSTGAKAFIANWQANTYTISFNANGGTVSVESMTVTFGENVTLPTPTISEGNFMGWYFETLRFSSGTWNYADNVTLIAKWDVRICITSADDLLNLPFLDGDYVLTQDIDLGGIEWTPIGTEDAPFTGSFDGNGYKISNFKVTIDGYTHVGLFGYNQGSITNLGVEDCKITTWSGVHNSTYAGCLVGYNEGSIIDCYALGNVHIESYYDYPTYAGGLCGYNKFQIINCHSNSTVYVDGGIGGCVVHAGGLVAKNEGMLKNCYASGNITGMGTLYAGGLIAYNIGTVVDCSASSTVTPDLCGTSLVIAGGLVCYNEGSITGCFASGDINNIGNCSDGISLGGLVGHNSVLGTINDCYATGDVTAENDYHANAYAGGLVGYNEGSISGCYATGSVNAYTKEYGLPYSGGLVGYNTLAGTINNCYATGNVSSENGLDSRPYAGGLVGYNEGSINNCYANGKISSETCDDTPRVGGLVGENSGTINNCYATGNITTISYYSPYTGGLVGYNEGSANNCCRSAEQTFTIKKKYGDVSSNEATNTIGTEKAVSELQSVSFHTTTLGWSTEIWEFTENSFPTLK